MGKEEHDGKRKARKKVRVPFRRNRSKPARPKDWTQRARQADDHELDAESRENIVAKGSLSRHRTILVPNDVQAETDPQLTRGTVVAMRGLYADVDDGERVWPCTVRRILRTRLIKERHPVTVGDHVWFRLQSRADGGEVEGTIETIGPRHGMLQRKTGKRIHTMVVNVDHAIIVSTADEPRPKPHLIDRYIVASLAGDIQPIVCMNKIDLDRDGTARDLAGRYTALGHLALITSATTGEGIDALRDLLQGKASVLAGQSGVGKSSLLNAVQPGLNLKTNTVSEQTRHGRHTTTTARLIRLDGGGYVVDTPGIRSLDLSTVPRNEFEAHFIEFVVHVASCKFADCTHRHEIGCAVKAAVENGRIHPDRYASYVRLFEDPEVCP